jgi:pantoate--beta-alanine ligase
MWIARTLAELAAARGGLDAPVGLVPTMGALHDGHLALVAAARRECRSTVASIFVNPLQFAPAEDLSRYPRDEAGDLDKLRDAGCALVWLPAAATMYPPGDATEIVPAGPALEWEGAQRPGHFRGVATVVAKLFGQVRPQRAFFGKKDWQQLQVVRRMVADLCLPVDVVGVATQRDADGLALSSRNRFLSGAERRVASLLPATLRQAAAEIAALAGGPAPWLGAAEPLLARAREDLATFGFGVDYLALVEPDSLREACDPAIVPAGGLRLIVAARLGPVRLLDNVGVPPA